MPYTFLDRLQHAWNAFTSRDPTEEIGMSYYRPDRLHSVYYNDQTIVTTIKNKIAVDCAQVDIRHVKRDKNGNYKKEINSHLNQALTTSANVDQTGRSFVQDLVQSMLDEGCVAAVPIDTNISPESNGSVDIYTLRVGEIVGWFPKHVRLNLYNENLGKKQQVVLAKSAVAIIENPFYSIMNEPNSTLRRLTRTLSDLDKINAETASGKLDLILQFPQSLRSPVKQQQAESRLTQIEEQLQNRKYGMAYIDATERITQLNRPIDNNLWTEAQDLTNMLFNQFGVTQSVFDGTANVNQMTYYYNRIIEPILTAIVEEMDRKFLTKNARSSGQKIVYIRDPFKIVGVTEIAEMAKIFTSNEIMSSNEVRGKIGLPPVDDKRANQLVNKNINKVEDSLLAAKEEPPVTIQNEDDEE